MEKGQQSSVNGVNLPSLGVSVPAQKHECTHKHLERIWSSITGVAVL